MPFRRLKQILSQYGCDCKTIRGSKILITRAVPRKLLGLKITKKLKSQIMYYGKGREVDKNTVAVVRRELELDELHGVDSNGFYQGGEICSSEFINRYRKTLSRLSDL